MILKSAKNFTYPFSERKKKLELKIYIGGMGG